MRLVIRDGKVLVSGSLVAAEIDQAKRGLGRAPAKKASAAKPERAAAQPAAAPAEPAELFESVNSKSADSRND